MANEDKNNLCGDCPFKAEIEQLKIESKRNEESHREFTAKLNSQEIRLAISEERYANLLSLITEIKTSVNEIKSIPAKRWNSIVITAISCVVTLIIGYALAQIGIN